MLAVHRVYEFPLLNFPSKGMSALFITLIMICEVEIHLIMVFHGWLSSLTCDYVIADDKCWFGEKIVHSSSVFSGATRR